MLSILILFLFKYQDAAQQMVTVIQIVSQFSALFDNNMASIRIILLRI